MLTRLSQWNRRGAAETAEKRLISWPEWPGVRLALTLVILAMSVLYAGCLVTDEVQFPEEVPIPSVLIDAPSARIKIGDIARISRTASAPNDLTLEVIVRDDNLDEVLFGRLRAVSKQSTRFLTGCDAETGEDTTVVPITGGKERMLSLPVARTDFAESGCYRLELVVSGSFRNTCDEAAAAPAVFTATSPRGDYGLAKWWLLVSDAPPGDASDENLEASCPIEDLDTPDTNAQ